MTETEREKLMVETCRMWPGKFPDDELADWCQRLNRYPLLYVMEALNQHKNSNKFRPQVSEILARLKGKDEVKKVSTAENTETQFDVRRQHCPQWSNASDAEVALRYWRQMWFRAGGFDEKRKASEGYRHQCWWGCKVDFLCLKYKEKDAERMTDYIFGSIEMFKLALSDIRGETVVDPFASTAA